MENTAQQTQEIKDEGNLRSQKMRNAPVGKLLLSMSLPAVISMLVQALYNVVDSIYVSRIEGIGELALTAVSLAFPMCMVLNSIGISIGVGANTYIARKLGERNQKDADNAAKTSLIMTLVSYAVVVILGLTISRPFIAAFASGLEGCTAEEIALVTKMGTDYLTIYMVCGLGALTELCCIRILQATGNMRIPMISQLVGAVSNIALDPLFIFGFNMGVKGAVIATVISQFAAGAVVFFTLLGGKQDVSIRMKGYRFQWKYVSQILKVGLPTFFMNAIMSFTTMMMNLIVRAYVSGTAVLSVYFKLQSFIYMPIFGMTQGASPILAYNYGACIKSRYNRTLKFAFIAAICTLVVGLLLFQTMPGLLLDLFEPSDEMRQLGTYAMRIISIGFIPSAVGILLITMFQSINKPILSMALSLTRTIGLVLPLALLFDKLWSSQGVWFCYPVAELLSVIIFIPLALSAYKKQFAYKQRQYEEGLLSSQDAELSTATETEQQ